MKLKWLGYAAIVLVWVVSVGYVLAQNTNSGDIRGTVTDTSGAVLPDVTVTVLNVETGVSKELKTNSNGIYDTSSIVLGTYTVTFTKDGFSQFVHSSITVDVGLTGVNAQLKVGAVTDQVVVNTDVPLLQTENGEQSTTFIAKEMSQLPNQNQDWQNFMVLLPGASGAPGGAQGAANPQQAIAANGNLPFSSILADGASSTLSHSSNADVNVFETVQELQVSTSAFSAQYGIGGIIFNQISKGGTNTFHGAAYEYFQNDALNAAGFFNSTKPKVRYNNFGGSIGGPVLRDKMFFYFNFDKIINNGTSTGFRTVPTLAMRQGDFSGQKTIYDPATQVQNGSGITRQAFPNNQIPAARFDSVANALQAFYPKPNVAVSTTADGVAVNNYYYQQPSNNPFNKYFGRLDYNITPSNRLTMSVQQRDNPAFYTNEGTCPINCYSGDVDSTNAQITDVWNISSRTINEARIGYTKQLNFFIPQTLNQGYPAKVGLQYGKADLFPTINVSQDCCYQLQPGTNAVYKEHVFDPSDVVTMIRGKHILHFGGEVLIYQDNSTAWGNVDAGTFKFTGQYTQSTVGDNASGIAYADFLLGATQQWSSTNTPEYGGRQKTPQMFIQDDYKLRPNLTINLGLRYQIQTGWSEVKNNERVFDPEIPNQLSGNLGAIWYAATAAHGRKSLQAPVYGTVLPRIGFAYQPHPNMVIRGGWGIYAYNWSLDTFGNGMGKALGSTGSTTDQTNGVTPVTTLSGTGASLPYVAATTSPTAFNGQGVDYNQYHTPVAKIYQWNLAVEHQVGADASVSIAYVASHGFNLPFPVDINQVPESRLSQNDTQFRPYPQYQGIGGGSTNNAISNYNSLQLSFEKRESHGLSFKLNHTWSKFLSDMDSSGWGSRAGRQIYQNAYNPSANYGPSNFDVRNAFKGSVVYRLPFGKDAFFLNKSRLLDTIIGGWRVSSTFVIQGGNPFTPQVGTNNSYAQAGNWYANQIRNGTLSHRTVDRWFDASAYAIPTPGTFGNVRRNSLYGPGLTSVNASLGKSFHIWEATELQIRADATNVFNHASFGLPGSNQTGPSGDEPNIDQANGVQIRTTTVGGRNLQLGARLSF